MIPSNKWTYEKIVREVAVRVILTVAIATIITIIWFVNKDTN